MTVRNGSDSLKWKYILLMFYYLKDGTNMTYEKACMVIGKQHLDKIIKYQDVIKEDEFIKMPLADNNWETYTKTKKVDGPSCQVERVKTDRDESKRASAFSSQPSLLHPTLTWK